MRKFIRHPSDIPIEILDGEAAAASGDHINNVSLGGLSFGSRVPFGVGSLITLRIAVVQPVFEALAKVAWCHEDQGHFDIGVRFLVQQDVFKVRMVEQVCYIEHYKKEILAKEGRSLDGREAALEWIMKYARDFPALEH